MDEGTYKRIGSRYSDTYKRWRQVGEGGSPTKEYMINKERLRAMRLEVLGTTLDGIDFKDEPLEQGVWEGLVFNIGKLLLEHLEEHRNQQERD